MALRQPCWLQLDKCPKTTYDDTSLSGVISQINPLACWWASLVIIPHHGAHFTNTFSYVIQIQWEIILFNSLVNYIFATKFYTCHDSTAVMACATFHTDPFTTTWMKAEWQNFDYDSKFDREMGPCCLISGMRIHVARNGVVPMHINPNHIPCVFAHLYGYLMASSCRDAD